jgi:hypothetical protein
MEEQLVEHVTMLELAALGRFYSTPEGIAIARKVLAINATTQPTLAAELLA